MYGQYVDLEVEDYFYLVFEYEGLDTLTVPPTVSLTINSTPDSSLKLELVGTKLYIFPSLITEINALSGNITINL